MFAIDSVGSPFRMRPTRLGLGSLPLDVDVDADVELIAMAVVALMFNVISRQSSFAGTYAEVAPVLVVQEEEEEEAASFQPTDVIPSNPMFVPKVASTGYSGPFTRAM